MVYENELHAFLLGAYFSNKNSEVPNKNTLMKLKREGISCDKKVFSPNLLWNKAKIPLTVYLRGALQKFFHKPLR